MLKLHLVLRGRRESDKAREIDKAREGERKRERLSMRRLRKNTMEGQSYLLVSVFSVMYQSLSHTHKHTHTRARVSFLNVEATNYSRNTITHNFKQRHYERTIGRVICASYSSFMDTHSKLLLHGCQLCVGASSAWVLALHGCSLCS